MKTFYVIKDIITNEYYWSYRIDDGFCTEVNSATEFYSKNEAIEQMKSEYLGDLFSGRTIEIKELYKFD